MAASQWHDAATQVLAEEEFEVSGREYEEIGCNALQKVLFAQKHPLEINEENVEAIYSEVASC